MDRNVCVLIPAYKPGMELLTLLKQIECETAYEIVVVDDGSGEEFKHIFQEAECINRVAVISYPQNRGKGHALKKGLKFCSEYFTAEHFSGVVTADADGQHLLKDIVLLGEALETCGNKLVLGVRCFKNDVPLRSKMGNNITIAVYRMASGMKISDTQTGLRGIPQNYIEEIIALEGERYEYEMNMLLALKELGMEAMEIPIETVYIDDNSGSHFNTFTDSARIYKLIIKKSQPIKYVLSAISSFILDYIIYSVILLFGLMSAANAQIPARIISSVYNYFVNKSYVFENKDNSVKNHLFKGVGYFALVLFNLFIIARPINSILIGWGVSEYLSQPIANVIQFTVSYFIQKLFIFRKKSN